jgi:hypothetical protein
MVSSSWKPRSGCSAFRNCASPAPNVLVDDDGRLRRPAGVVVDGDEIVDSGLRDDAEARAEADGVGFDGR